MTKLLLLSALLASTCELGPFPKPPPEPEPPSPWDRPVADAGPPAPPTDNTPCGRACAKLASLGCDEAKPTPAGASCAQVCENIESSGVVTMGPECVARAASCSVAKACGQ